MSQVWFYAGNIIISMFKFHDDFTNSDLRRGSRYGYRNFGQTVATYQCFNSFQLYERSLNVDDFL